MASPGYERQMRYRAKRDAMRFYVPKGLRARYADALHALGVPTMQGDLQAHMEARVREAVRGPHHGTPQKEECENEN